MNVELEGTKLNLNIDLRELFQDVTAPQVLLDIAQNLAITDKVIMAVAEQIVHRCTEEGWHGLTSNHVGEHAYGLDLAIRMVIMARDDICARERKRLSVALEDAERRAREAWQEVHDIRRKYEWRS